METFPNTLQLLIKLIMQKKQIAKSLTTKDLGKGLSLKRYIYFIIIINVELN